MSIGPSKILPKRIKDKIRRSPKARKIVYPIYARYLRLHIRFLTWWKTGRHYKARIDPFKVIYVDPKEIKYKASLRSEVKHKGRYLIPKVIDGDWDKEIEPFSELSIFQACKARFEGDKDWSETKRYRKVQERIREGKSSGGISKEKNIDRYFQNLEELYEDIKQNGYKEQKDLESGRKSFRVNQRSIIDRYLGELNEVVINIDRSGNYLFRDGRHRLSVAKLLRLDKIPVRIFVRHQEWQKKREKFLQNPGELEEKYLNHPDIR